MDKFRYYENQLRSADKLTIIYQLIIAAVIAFNFTKIPQAVYWLFMHVGFIIFLYRLPEMGSNRLLNMLRLWNPVLFITTNFFELPYLVHQVNPNDIDPLLVKADYAMFGLHPTVWMENLANPMLTEYLQIVYSLFYFLPLILAVLLYFENRMREFDFFAMVLVYGFYLSYIGYFLFPALGPRYTIAEMHSTAISGLWFTEHIRTTLDTLEKVQRDAFPSGHTMMTALTMFYAARYHKKYFAVLLVIGSSLIFSTVYLRYHYVSDVLAGLVFALLVVVTAPALYKRLNHNQPYGGDAAGGQSK